MSIDCQTEIRNTTANMRSIKRQAIWDVTGGVCFYCLRALLPDELGTFLHPLYMTVDHKVPSSRGGTEDFDNLVPCCRSCNSNKGNKTISEYRLYLFKHGRLNFFYGEPSLVRDWLLICPFDPRWQALA